MFVYLVRIRLLLARLASAWKESLVKHFIRGRSEMLSNSWTVTARYDSGIET